MEAAGLPVPPEYVADGVSDGIAADEAMCRMLSLPAPPTAVVCVTDAVAIAAMRAISRAGLQVGRDVSVVGFDGLPIGLSVEPPLATMSQASHKAGRMIAKMLRAQIEGERKPIQKLWEATLLPRASAGPPVGASHEGRA
jgi:LacI family transcriptional regulator